MDNKGVDRTKAALSKGEVYRKNGEIKMVKKGTGPRTDDVLVNTSPDFAVLGNNIDPETGLPFKVLGQQLYKKFGKKKYLPGDPVSMQAQELNNQALNAEMEQLLQRQEMVNQMTGRGGEKTKAAGATTFKEKWGGYVPRHEDGSDDNGDGTAIGLGVGLGALGLAGIGAGAYAGGLRYSGQNDVNQYVRGIINNSDVLRNVNNSGINATILAPRTTFQYPGTNIEMGRPTFPASKSPLYIAGGTKPPVVRGTDSNEWTPGFYFKKDSPLDRFDSWNVNRQSQNYVDNGGDLSTLADQPYVKGRLQRDGRSLISAAPASLEQSLARMGRDMNGNPIPRTVAPPRPAMPQPLPQANNMPEPIPQADHGPEPLPPVTGADTEANNLDYLGRPVLQSADYENAAWGNNTTPMSFRERIARAAGRFANRHLPNYLRNQVVGNVGRPPEGQHRPLEQGGRVPRYEDGDNDALGAGVGAGVVGAGALTGGLYYGINRHRNNPFNRGSVIDSPYSVRFDKATPTPNANDFPITNRPELSVSERLDSTPAGLHMRRRDAAERGSFPVNMNQGMMPRYAPIRGVRGIYPENLSNAEFPGLRIGGTPSNIQYTESDYNTGGLDPFIPGLTTEQSMQSMNQLGGVSGLDKGGIVRRYDDGGEEELTGVAKGAQMVYDAGMPIIGGLATLGGIPLTALALNKLGLSHTNQERIAAAIAKTNQHAGVIGVEDPNQYNTGRFGRFYIRRESPFGRLGNFVNRRVLGNNADINYKTDDLLRGKAKKVRHLTGPEVEERLAETQTNVAEANTNLRNQMRAQDTEIRRVNPSVPVIEDIEQKSAGNRSYVSAGESSNAPVVVGVRAPQLEGSSLRDASKLTPPTIDGHNTIPVRALNPVLNPPAQVPEQLIQLQGNPVITPQAYGGTIRRYDDGGDNRDLELGVGIGAGAPVAAGLGYGAYRLGKWNRNRRNNISEDDLLQLRRNVAERNIVRPNTTDPLDIFTTVRTDIENGNLIDPEQDARNLQRFVDRIDARGAGRLTHYPQPVINTSALNSAAPSAPISARGVTQWESPSSMRATQLMADAEGGRVPRYDDGSATGRNGAIAALGTVGGAGLLYAGSEAAPRIARWYDRLMQERAARQMERNKFLHLAEYPDVVNVEDTPSFGFEDAPDIQPIDYSSVAPSSTPTQILTKTVAEAEGGRVPRYDGGGAGEAAAYMNIAGGAIEGIGNAITGYGEAAADEDYGDDLYNGLMNEDETLDYSNVRAHHIQAAREAAMLEQAQGLQRANMQKAQGIQLAQKNANNDIALRYMMQRNPNLNPYRQDALRSRGAILRQAAAMGGGQGAAARMAAEVGYGDQMMKARDAVAQQQMSQNAAIASMLQSQGQASVSERARVAQANASERQRIEDVNTKEKSRVSQANATERQRVSASNTAARRADAVHQMAADQFNAADDVRTDTEKQRIKDELKAIKQRNRERKYSGKRMRKAAKWRKYGVIFQGVGAGLKAGGDAAKEYQRAQDVK